MAARSRSLVAREAFGPWRGPNERRRYPSDVAAPNESPYQRALGVHLTQLHPVLQTYFATLPPRRVGVGEGVFDYFGTRRWWLRPLLALFATGAVIIPGMHLNVPFRIENRTVGGRATAQRTLMLKDGTWAMRDSVSFAGPLSVVDALGVGPIVNVRFRVAVADGALELVSAGVRIQFGNMRLSVPSLLAPTIRLNERFDETANVQRVDLTVEAPIIGRVYGYRGSFTYRIEDE